MLVSMWLCTLAANAYVVVYCDKEESGLHTNFRLETGKDGNVYLFQGDEIVDKVELAANPNFWNFYLLGEVHPFKNQPFYFSAGLFVGSQNFVHFRNTNEGALGFLYDANQKVEDYNRLYRTNYPPIGLKFGDYIFTADENGNIDVRMKTNAVKPYIGVGFGQHLAKTHRVSLAVDAGLLFWGTPKFVLNNGTEIDSSGRNSGITGALKWLKAWPNIQVRVAYKIF